MVEQIKVTRLLHQFPPGTHRPGSVDIDSFYEDGTMDLMTKFTNDVRRVIHKNSHRPRGSFGRGLTKKKGAGGQFTWGAELTPDQLENGMDPIMDNSDPLDPNYDSDSEENCKFEAILPPLEEDEVDEYLTPILQEYFEHGVTQEVLTSLEEVNLSGNRYRITIVLVSLALDRKSSHRELASILISDLFGSKVLTSEHIQHGFDMLLQQLDDLELDTPDACTILGNFIARAIADDCIPPKYVTEAKERLESKLEKGVARTNGICNGNSNGNGNGNGNGNYNGNELKEQSPTSGKLSPAETRALVSLTYANSLINTKSHLIHSDTIWGLTGGARPVKYLIKRMRLLLKEYLSSLDAKEAERCLRELEVPHFYHEFVYETVLMAVENTKKPDETMALAKLLKALSDINLISVDQMKKGFLRLFNEMPDIHIDVPHAYITLERFMQACFSLKLFLPHDVIASVPSRGRKRFISEGDGGRFKD